MTTAAAPAVDMPTSEPGNFLNLVIVDDERSIREVCREVARNLGFNALVADSAEHTYRLLESHAIDVILLDLKLPGAGGLEALNKIKQQQPDAEVIVVTGCGTVQSAVQAMKNGAYDYVTKPFSMDELRILLERVSAHLKLKSENRILRERIKSKQGFSGNRGYGAGDGAVVPHDRQSVAEPPPRVDPGRERHGQRVGGAVDSLFRSLSRQAFHPCGLRFAWCQP